MISLFFIPIFILYLVLEILAPKRIDKKIREYILSINGELVSIQCLSKYRTYIYLVEYNLDGKFIRQNVKSNIWAEIEWI